MRALVLSIVLAGCSSSAAQPKLSETVTAQLKALAPNCQESPGHPDGYHTDIICMHPDGPQRATVSIFLAKPGVLGEVQITLGETVDAAIPRIEEALTGLLTAKDLAIVTRTLRAAAKDPKGSTLIAGASFKGGAKFQASPLSSEVWLRWRAD